MSRSVALLPLLMLLCACGGGGGGSPSGGGGVNASLTLTLPASGLTAAELAVVVAEGDPLSEAVGAAYVAARGVPAANLIRVRVNTGSEALSATDFALLKSDIDARLPAGVQATLLTWAAPSRVVGSCAMGITSAMALGYDPRYCNPAPAAELCASTAASPLYDSEARRPGSELQLRPSMLLGARTLAAAQALIARGVAADASRPAGEGWLVRTTDVDRSVRWSDFATLPAAWSGALALNYVDNSAGPASANSLSGKSGVLFYLTGLTQVASLATLQFRPGALADSLTSSGGLLPGGGGPDAHHRLAGRRRHGQLRHGGRALQSAAEVHARLGAGRPLLARRHGHRGLLEVRAMARPGPVRRRAPGPALSRHAELCHRGGRVSDQDAQLAAGGGLQPGLSAGRHLDDACQLHRRARPGPRRPRAAAAGGGDAHPVAGALPGRRGEQMHPRPVALSLP